MFGSNEKPQVNERWMIGVQREPTVANDGLLEVHLGARQQVVANSMLAAKTE
jgi:hypothetical protein